MKFIHCSDVHLGAPHTSISADKALIRKRELFATFEKLCDYAVENQVVAVIISGDLFDVKKITKKLKDSVFGCISNAKNVDFLYLPGNHDSQIFSSSDNLPDNLKVFSANAWSSFRYNNINIQGAFFDRANSQTIYSSLQCSKNDFNIVVLHGQIANYKNDEDTEIISLPLLKDKNINYLALGHYHSFASGSLGANGVFAYSGTLEGRGFDETGDKGFVLIDTDLQDNFYQFVPFAYRKLYEVNYTIDFSISWYENKKNIITYLKEQFPTTSLIKLVLQGSKPINYIIDKADLESTISTIYFYAKVEDKCSLQIETSAYLDDKSIKGEFFRLVAQSDLDSPTKSKVIACGLNALSGEDLL